jgi:hypothetical protein
MDDDHERRASKRMPALRHAQAGVCPSLSRALGSGRRRFRRRSNSGPSIGAVRAGSREHRIDDPNVIRAPRYAVLEYHALAELERHPLSLGRSDTSVAKPSRFGVQHDTSGHELARLVAPQGPCIAGAVPSIPGIDSLWEYAPQSRLRC